MQRAIYLNFYFKNSHTLEFISAMYTYVFNHIKQECT